LFKSAHQPGLLRLTKTYRHCVLDLAMDSARLLFLKASRLTL